MTARGGDGQGALRVLLSLYFRNVDQRRSGRRRKIRRDRGERFFVLEVKDEFSKGCKRVDRDTLHDTGLESVRGGKEQAPAAATLRKFRERKRAACGTQFAGEREFAYEHGIVRLEGRDLAGCHEVSQGDREVVVRTGLFDV